MGCNDIQCVNDISDRHHMLIVRGEPVGNIGREAIPGINPGEDTPIVIAGEHS
jgi:hypothetical protein